MAFELRKYQRESLDELSVYWAGNNGGNALIVLPTGAGKSLVIAALCQELLRDFPTLRIGITVYARPRIDPWQDYDELMALWPQAPAGIYSAGMNRRDTRSQILFCGIQSVWNKTDRLGNLDLLLIDEAHLVPRSASTTYRRFIDRLREDTPDMRVVGLTATAFRLDSGQLHKGDDKIFDDIVYDANVRDLIEHGYLCPLVSKATAQKLDVSGVGKRGGEFIPGQLEVAVDKDWITRGAVDERWCSSGPGVGPGSRFAPASVTPAMLRRKSAPAAFHVKRSRATRRRSIATASLPPSAMATSNA